VGKQYRSGVGEFVRGELARRRSQPSSTALHPSAYITVFCDAAKKGLEDFRCKRLRLGGFGSVEGDHAPLLCLPNVYLRESPVIGEFLTIDLAGTL
jgi:hypothetical protein